MKNTLPKILSCVALLTVLVWGAINAQQVTSFNTTAVYDPARVVAYNVYVADAPLTAIGGTGHVFSDTTLSDGTEDVTLTAANDPDSPRELIIFQSENSGTALVVDYAINVTNWDGTTTTHTLTLTTTDSFSLPTPVLGVNRLFITIDNAAASDAIKIGYRSFWAPGAYPTAANNVIHEAVNGVVPGTAATIPKAGFILPNSVAAGNEYSVLVRSTTTQQQYRLQQGIGQATGTIDWGTNP